jgi:hypothetical protein
MKKSLLFLFLILSLDGCQSGPQEKTELTEPKLITKWPDSLAKVIIFCSSDQVTIEVTKENFKKKHDCQDLPGASAIKPVFKTKNDSPVRVSAQTTKHLTLMNEGPHVDLTQWKSTRTEMIELNYENHRYPLKRAKEAPSKSFPNFSNEELVEAVKEELKTWGGKIDSRWLELAKECGTNPDKYPCGLGPSEYKIRLEVPGDEAALEFAVAIPMGC